MFHTVSQASALLLTPTNALVILTIVGSLLAMTPWAAALGRRLAGAAAITLCLLAMLPIGDGLLERLESRFPPFSPDARPITGIIILGGSLSPGGASTAPYPAPNQAADRLFEAANLARAYPAARVLVSGGPVDRATRASEADSVALLLARLGVAPGRITRERRSADTFENARFSAAAVRPGPDQRWLLVTSAFHMPRAIACFRAAGFSVQAAPADWRAGGSGALARWSASGNLQKVDLAWKEYLGLVVYRLRGRTAALFPGP